MKNLTSVMIDNDKEVGQLGNKLFVVACGLSLSKQYNINYAIPTWKYQNDFPNISIVNDFSTFGSIQNYNQDGYHYTPITLGEGDTTNLIGYFQSYKYFNDIKDELINKYFDPVKDIKTEIDTLFNCVKGINITSIHVRRGDYLEVSDYHPPCTMEYYNKAIKELDCITDRFLVFSDDISWCKENFKGDKFLFSEGRRNVVDMFMISKCNNHIIANSSFSWWGAWLCKYKDAKIIAPQKWFGYKYDYYNMNDLRPEEWLLM